MKTQKPNPLWQKHETDQERATTEQKEKLRRSQLHWAVGCVEAEDKEPLPKWKYYYANFMIFWAVAAHISILLSLIKIYAAQNADGVSLPAYGVSIFSNVIWLVYSGWVLKDRNPILMISHTVALSLNIVVLIGCVLYGNRPKDCSAQIAAALAGVKV
jgi:uncharacterized protein with PQ loop repeat